MLYDDKPTAMCQAPSWVASRPSNNILAFRRCQSLWITTNILQQISVKRFSNPKRTEPLIAFPSTSWHFKTETMKQRDATTLLHVSNLSATRRIPNNDSQFSLIIHTLHTPTFTSNHHRHMRWNLSQPTILTCHWFWTPRIPNSQETSISSTNKTPR